MSFSRRDVMVGGAVLSAAPLLAKAPAGAPAPWGSTPSARQLAWHMREQYAFVHFSINTFTDREWGFGDESPKLFNPSDFDPDQIVGAAKAAGLTALILVAKHHDGFCLWPTKLTEYCIRNSPYKQGKGDVVGEMERAARRAGLGFGLYLSPWDRNHPEYGRPAYLDYFRAQVVELCTRYGELFEFWFDGANGGDGYYGGARETRKIDAPKYYDWPSIVALVHKHQPMACTFDPLGAEIRWVGNEHGIAGDPCWPTMPNHLYVQAEGNSGVRGAPLWWPAEADVSIRPGWFYHSHENAKVKSPAQLIDLHGKSVGRGVNLNLSLAPDRRGRIPDHDIAVLKSYGDAQAATYADNLAKGATAHASDERGGAFAAGNVLDGRRDTYWSTPDDVKTPSLVIDVSPGTRFDLIRIREFLPLGVRVTRFAIDLEESPGWRTVAEHECIGAQRIVRLPKPSNARRLRLRIVDAPACPAISEVALFRQVQPVAVAPPKAAASGIIPNTGWTIASASAPGSQAAIDGEASTVWRLPAPTAARPASITIDLAREQLIAGFSLTPLRAVEKGTAPPRDYRCETSIDGKAWTRQGAGEFSNIAYALATQRIDLKQPERARYLRLTFTAPAVAAERLGIVDIGAFSNLSTAE